MLRIQSADGTRRVELNSNDKVSSLFEKVRETFELNSSVFALYKDRNHKEEIASSISKHVNDYRLQHGDMLYLAPLNGSVLFDQPQQPSTSAQVCLNQCPHFLTLPDSTAQSRWDYGTLNIEVVKNNAEGERIVVSWEDLLTSGQ